MKYGSFVKEGINLLFRMMKLFICLVSSLFAANEKMLYLLDDGSTKLRKGYYESCEKKMKTRNQPEQNVDNPFIQDACYANACGMQLIVDGLAPVPRT